MKHTQRILPAILFLSLIFLSACGANATPEATPIDPEAIFTSAAETVAAQLTQTAVAFSPTPEPATATPAAPTATLAPFNTPAPLTTAPAGFPGTPTTIAIGSPAPLPSPTQLVIQPTQDGPLCDDAAFVADITIPDGTIMKPGEDFYKVWRIQNTGTCTWDDGFGLVFAFGDPLDGPGYEITSANNFVAPGATTDIGINMTAHLAEGEYSGCWRMRNDRNVLFGGIVCVSIVVQK